jgi:hypothetical protein
MGDSGRIPGHAANGRNQAVSRFLAISVLAAVGYFSGWLDSSAVAASPSAQHGGTSAASTSDSARQDAIHSIPLEQLSREDRMKVNSVLNNVSIFRRMPVKVVDCDPDMYLFLVRHPDIVTSVWDLMKISRIQLRQTGENQFQINESEGTSAQFGYVYRSHNLHVLYGEGTYEGPLLAKPIKGRGVLVLKCGYVRETNGRYYITSRLDGFIAIEPAGAELIGKTVSPLMGKTVDNNFIQTLAFVGSLSRTTEVNSRGVQRLALQLKNVSPDVRIAFSELAADVGEKSAAASTPKKEQRAELSNRPGTKLER